MSKDLISRAALLEELKEREVKARQLNECSGCEATMLRRIMKVVERQPEAKDELARHGKWNCTKDRLPTLPDCDWCRVMVITATKGETKCHPMIYERSVVRGKHVERWLYHWDRIADKQPDYWMPFPMPPKED